MRDLDIQLGKLEDWCQTLPGEHGQALDDLGDLLTDHREAARARLLDALDSRRYERLLSGLDAMIDHGPSRRSIHAKSPAVAALPELIGERHRAAVRAAKRAQASRVLSDFHRLRIRCKRLRYAIEFTAGLYGNDVKRFAKQVAALQDALGLIQDADVAYARLRTIATTGEGAALSHPTVFAMGMVAERSREEAESRLGALSAPADMLRGPGWRRAVVAFEDARASAADRVEQPGRRNPGGGGDHCSDTVGDGARADGSERGAGRRRIRSQARGDPSHLAVRFARSQPGRRGPTTRWRRRRSGQAGRATACSGLTLGKSSSASGWAAPAAATRASKSDCCRGSVAAVISGCH